MPPIGALLFLLLISARLSRQKWSDPPFLENEIEKEKGRVQLGQLENNGQLIYMNENIEEEVFIAYFINYEGNDAPVVERFVSNTNQTLGLVISKSSENGDNSQWGLLITISQDFETIESYVFSVSLEGRALNVILQINNLDDNPPIIKMRQNPCVIQENYIGITDCKYDISDADGIMENTVIYEIHGTDESLPTIFEFRHETEIKNGMKNWVAVLHTLKPLDFDIVQVYMFDFVVKDSGDNNGTATIIARVKNMPLRPPGFRSIVPLKQFDEKTEQIMHVEAYDRDLEVNSPIWYSLETKWPHFFSIESTNGTIFIEEIDRDTEMQEVFEFTVIATEVMEPKFNISQDVTIIVNDINDHSPTIKLIGDLPLAINESTATTLQLDVDISDPDLAENAMFDVYLKCDNEKIDYSEAFQIIPDQGYQHWVFKISTANYSMLDYEEPEWQNFEFQVFVQERANLSHTDIKSIQIELINLNDELPIFEKEEYRVSIPEDIDINGYIETVLAVDRDIDDVVTHEIMGNSSKKLFHIDEETGVVTTAVKNALDYEIVQFVFVTIQAQDSLLGVHHKVYAQLEIEVLDVNDTPPKFRPTESISVDENQKDGYLINEDVDIIAEDVDTEADMLFEILWDKSSATKNGQRVLEKEFKDCLTVETFRFEDNNNMVKALLYINEIYPNNTPDFEKYDTLYLQLKVTDTNQTVIMPNTDETRIIINIGDLNDNAPVFNQEEYKFLVKENTDLETFINKVLATDADGPPFNNVTYYLKPSDENTPDGWVSVTPLDGTVYVSGAIDADLPIWWLNYEVEATDGELSSFATLRVEVIDENDNFPDTGSDGFSIEVKIYEKSANGTPVQIIKATDIDRDEMYKTPWYGFSPLIDSAQKFFSIDRDTGLVYVHLKTAEVLDRDLGDDRHGIFFIYADNLKLEGSQRQNKNESTFVVKLLDINDHAPIIKTESLSSSEEVKKGTQIGILEAEDLDEKGHPNSQIDFKVLSVRKGENAGQEPPNDLFSIATEDINSGLGIVTVNFDLEGFYGTYEVDVMAFDFGEEPQHSNKTIRVEIKKYNFKSPSFTYPTNEEIIFLSKKQDLHNSLRKFGGSMLDHIKATDNQNDKWNLKFSISSETDPEKIFYFETWSKNEADLRLDKTPNYNKGYDLTINVNCDCEGDPPYDTDVSVKIRFIDTDTEPYFIENQQYLSFTENETGLNDVQQLNRAVYSDTGEDWDQFPIYYQLIMEDPMAHHFKLDKLKAELELVEMLDREEIANFTIRVVASQKENGVSNPQLESILNVNIKVIDVNDNPPNFEKKEYSSVLTTLIGPGDLVLTVLATDLDENDTLTYVLLDDTLKANGSGIGNIARPFVMNSFTGEIRANFVVLNSMSGYFSFTIEVSDTVFKDTASVVVYIVADKNRSVFKFENDLETVENSVEEIKRVLENHFPELTCNIDKVQRANTETGEASNTETDVYVYFINSSTNSPIDNDAFQRNLDVNTYIALKNDFLKEKLSLVSLGEDGRTFETETDKVRYILMGTTAVLTVLLLLVLTYLFFKIRGLRRKIKTMTVPADTSDEFGSGKMGFAAPNTNKRAFEGANPVFNQNDKVKQVDTVSIDSGDSDLIGIEDDPTFDIPRQPPYKFSKEKYQTGEEDC